MTPLHFRSLEAYRDSFLGHFQMDPGKTTEQSKANLLPQMLHVWIFVFTFTIDLSQMLSKYSIPWNIYGNDILRRL